MNTNGPNLYVNDSSGGSATSSYSQAYFASSGTPIWTGSGSGSFADFSLASGTATLTVRKSSGIVLTAAASSLPGITFTPPSTSAIYLITCSTVIYQTTAGGGVVAYQLTDGTNVLVSGPAVSFENASSDFPITMSGVYSPGTTSAVTVKIQQRTSGVTAEIGVNSSYSPEVISWTVVRLL